MGPDDLAPSQQIISPMTYTGKKTYTFNLKPTTPGPQPPISTIPSSSYMYKADLVVASIRGKTRVVKNKYNDPDETEIIDAVCRLLSCHIFGNKYQLFVPAFEEDVKNAVEGVVNKHHLEGKI